MGTESKFVKRNILQSIRNIILYECISNSMCIYHYFNIFVFVVNNINGFFIEPKLFKMLACIKRLPKTFCIFFLCQSHFLYLVKCTIVKKYQKFSIYLLGWIKIFCSEPDLLLEENKNINIFWEQAICISAA